MRLESVVVIPEMQPGYGVYGIRLLGHKLPKPQIKHVLLSHLILYWLPQDSVTLVHVGYR